MTFKGFAWNTEYAYKINDPSYDNGYIYRPGTAFLSTLSFSKKGLGILASVKRIDNMSFRSNRDGQQFDLFINFLPPTTKPHTYALAALYPYATQVNGEMGGQFEINYMIPRGSKLGANTARSSASTPPWPTASTKAFWRTVPVARKAPKAIPRIPSPLDPSCTSAT